MIKKISLFAIALFAVSFVAAEDKLTKDVTSETVTKAVITAHSEVPLVPSTDIVKDPSSLTVAKETIKEVAKDAAVVTEGYFASAKNTVAAKANSLESWCSKNPKTAIALATTTAVIATIITIAKSKTVQDILGFQTAENDPVFN